MSKEMRQRGFTIIELLVVISIIGLLLGILLPALGSAKKTAMQARSASNLRNVGQGVLLYEVEQKHFPMSYVYAAAPDTSQWNESAQQETNPVPSNGYVHWSWFLFDDGEIPGNAFENPAAPGGGAPRANPGPRPEDWEPGQVNDLGQAAPAANPIDRQVPRMGYTANAAIIPRNKFNVATPRRNQFVKLSQIDDGQKVILATEFQYYDNWTSLADPLSGVIKSHRPVMPFVGGSAGSNVYLEPNQGSIARFAYPPESAFLPDNQIGANLIEDGNTQLNAVWRGHPRKQANFVYIDGHVEGKTVQETVKNREWGNRVLSLSGDNRVNLDANPWP